MKCAPVTRSRLIMASSREYPERPLVGVGGVVIDNGRALLIRRASEPLRGEWSIPGGMLELGETLEEGVARELLEETGLQVRVLELIEVFDRIVYAPNGETAGGDELRSGRVSITSSPIIFASASAVNTPPRATSPMWCLRMKKI